LLSEAIKKDPGYLEGWWLLSFAIEDPQKQVYALQRALQLSPNNQKLLERLAKLNPEGGESLAPALSWQLPASSAVTSTREGRVWAGLIGGGLAATLAVAALLTFMLRAEPARANQGAEVPVTGAQATSTRQQAAAPTRTPQATATTAAGAAQPTQAPTLAPTQAAPTQAASEDDTTVTLITDSQTEVLALPAFDRFVQSVANGNSNDRVGVFVEDQFQYPIVQQPANNPAFVTSNQGEVTEFRIVRQQTGNEGLIAHNYLAGGSFFNLQVGDVAQVVLGDGSVIEFEIFAIHDFQALSPNSPTSDFLNLDTGEKLSASELFYMVYGGELTLTFQTCINRNNVSTWGRTFVIGEEI
jgi:hypothetical protein